MSFIRLQDNSKERVGPTWQLSHRPWNRTAVMVEMSEEAVLKALAEYGKCGGIVGLYYVNQFKVPQWRSHLTAAGYMSCCVEADSVGRPRLPNFE